MLGKCEVGINPKLKRSPLVLYQKKLKRAKQNLYQWSGILGLMP